MAIIKISERFSIYPRFPIIGGAPEGSQSPDDETVEFSDGVARSPSGPSASFATYNRARSP
jgi:hypothetical protein